MGNEWTRVRTRVCARARARTLACARARPRARPRARVHAHGRARAFQKVTRVRPCARVCLRTHACLHARADLGFACALDSAPPPPHPQNHGLKKVKMWNSMDFMKTMNSMEILRICFTPVTNPQVRGTQTGMTLYIAALLICM